MAVLTPHTIFHHIPKTGGTWVRAALRESGLPCTELKCRQCTRPETTIANRICCLHNTAANAQPLSDQLLRFAFVRHPLSYYRSYWSYRMQMGWDPVLEIDREAGGNDFHTFVRAVLRVRPGWVTKLYTRFAGSKDEPALHFIGKQEQLADDLIRVLTIAGESFDEAAIRRVAPENMSARLPEWRDRCQYTPELRDAVLEAEREAVERFYAASPVPQEL